MYLLKEHLILNGFVNDFCRAIVYKDLASGCVSLSKSFKFISRDSAAEVPIDMAETIHLECSTDSAIDIDLASVVNVVNNVTYLSDPNAKEFGIIRLFAKPAENNLVM